VRLVIDERVKRTMFALWCLAWLVVLVASLRPLQQMPFGLQDEMIHFACYAATTAALATFCHEVRGLLRWSVFTVVMGGLVEVAQHFVPARRPSFDDFLADAAGVACGLLLALLWLAVVVRPLRRVAA
jgi:VanZ family protein